MFVFTAHIVFGCLVVVLVGLDESRYGLTDPSCFWPVCKPSMVFVKNYSVGNVICQDVVVAA